ncbi:MAG: single-stranded-DNA-specific exonuclease RecJ [Desulfobacteraceae bacterium 4572_88]|nr:MAG: single-stranded-DNA-specific exonuclease RecJ [Desulfobacteraceae bacterium 4572_88]
MNKNWKILQPDAALVDNICNTVECSPVLATVLANRNICSRTAASRFFNNSLGDLRPPFAIKDMDVAVRRIYQAVTGNEKILIFGDYDVDGITATTLLLEFLEYAGADVSFYIPHRVREGYNLRPRHISSYALPNKTNLIITVDCGSGSHDAIEMAQDAGIDVIITDHHNISRIPKATAVVNPKRHDCTAGFECLAGVGVAFCLVIALRKHLRDMNFWRARPEPNLKPFCDLVALGTVADVVPLVNENRIFSKTGLEVINSGKRLGVRALLKACGIGNNFANAEDISFRMAPRLNAAGRMDHAKRAVSLLRSDDLETAREIAQSLNHLNKSRQEAEKEILEDISVYLDAYPQVLRQKTLVLSRPGWHEGILGIVASKMAEKTFRPVILIGTRNGVGKGSGRSIPGIDLHKGLVACSQDLDFFGGHPMAAGLTIKTDQIEVFKKNFETAISEMAGSGNFSPSVSIDYELDFDEISDELIDELETLQPFGEGNQEPLFMARNIRVVSSKIVGENHRRMLLKQAFSGRTSQGIQAIHFNVDTHVPLKKHFDRMAFHLRWNRWNGKRTAQLLVEEA